jgi:diguanylate cyclase (GGDEF)-like protein
MKSPNITEEQRLTTLASYQIVGTGHEARFDDILSALINTCNVPMAKLAFVDADTSWYKSSIGLSFTSRAREISFAWNCVVEPNRTVIIPDVANSDAATRNLLANYPDGAIIAVAAIPLVAPNGAAIGAMILMDTKQHDFTMSQVESLARAGRKVMELLESGKAAREMQAAENPIIGASSNKAATAADSTGTATPTLDTVTLATLSDSNLDALAAEAFKDGSRDVVSELVQEILSSTGWWAAQAWWAEEGNLYPDNWQFTESTPASVRLIDDRASAGRVPEHGIQYAEPTRLGVDDAPWLGAPDVLRASGVRHVVVLDIAGVVGLALRIAFVLPNGADIPPAALQALTTASLLLPKVIRQERARGELHYRSTHDPLTGLLNRRGLEQTVAPLERANNSQIHAVVFMDLDNFKGINDTYGHNAGDELLNYVAQALNKQLRPTDSIARLGGDEFVVVATNVGSVDRAYATANRLLAAVNGSFVSQGGTKLKTAASVGVAVWRSGTIFADALRIADALMYQAKQVGGSLAIEDLASGSPAHNFDGSIPVQLSSLKLINANAKNVVHFGSNQTVALQVTVESLLRTVEASQVAKEIAEAIPEEQSNDLPIILELPNHCWATPEFVSDTIRSLHRLRKLTNIQVAIDSGLVTTAIRSIALDLKKFPGVTLLLSNFGNGSNELGLIESLDPVGLCLAPRVIGSGSGASSGQQGSTPTPIREKTVRAAIAIGEALNLQVYALNLSNREVTKTLISLGSHLGSFNNEK